MTTRGLWRLPVSLFSAPARNCSSPCASRLIPLSFTASVSASATVASFRPVARYNEKVDTYSFSIILWEMAGGRLPFAGYSMEIFMLRVVKAGERPIIQFSWPDDFKKLLVAGWAPKPDERPSFREINGVLSGMKQTYKKKPSKKRLFGGW
ncbi:unnamed protein product [Discosporangium mesarthrocarpum]